MQIDVEQKEVREAREARVSAVSAAVGYPKCARLLYNYERRLGWSMLPTAKGSHTVDLMVGTFIGVLYRQGRRGEMGVSSGTRRPSTRLR